MTKLALSAILAGLVSLGAAGSAHAQSKTADDTTKAEAKQRFSEGIKFADQGDHESARLKFNQAWALLKSPAILFNLARSEQLSNHPVESLEHYRMFLKMGSDPKVTEQQKQSAAENQAELTKKLGQIEVEAPAGAKVTIDGKPVDWTPNSDPYPVLPGKHVVEETADGKTQTANIDCDAGTVTKAKLKEPPAPPPAAPVIATPAPAPGNGFWTTGRAVGASLAGVGVVGVVLGVMFQLKASSASDDAAGYRAKLPSASTSCAAPTADLKSTCDSLASKNSDVSTDQNLRTAFFIGGGALLVGGAVLFLVSPPKGDGPTRGMTFLPYASAGGGGATVLGRF